MRKLLKFGLALVMMGFISLFLFYTIAAFTPLELDSKKERFTIYDINNNILYETNFKKELTWTPIEEIPEKVQQAVVAVEDKRFYQHHGFDVIRIVKALISNFAEGRIVEGGSTITQQMAKNLFLSNEQTFTRKLEELFYAARLEMQYDKEAILEGYLNTLYYGHGVYGIKEAADFFFGCTMDELDNAQLAMLIGIPNGPSLYSPLINEENAKQRQSVILEVMKNAGLINETEMLAAKAESLFYNEDHQENTNASYYIQAVIDEVNAMISRGEISLKEGGNIYTYYDPEVQKKLVESFRNHVDLNDELETSAIITQPFTGNILAIQGGKDYTITQYNRSIYAHRQVASTIKPLLYYTALESGFTPSTTFMSTPTTFQIDEQSEYAPTNYNELYPNREISMINAIAMSDNIYAVKTHLFLGMDTLDNALKAFGINNSQAVPSLALGTVDMSLLELSTVYNTFASCGLYIQPAMISTITNNYNNVIYERNMETKRLMNLDSVLMINQMLTATFDIKNKTVNFPTMYGSEPKVQVGAKSGTSEADSLVIGFNPDYTIAVWSGFDDSRYLDKEYYNITKRIFQSTFNSLYEGEETAAWYQMTNTLTERRVDPITGKDSLLGSVYWFKKE